MKISKLAFFLIGLVVVFNACQKEYSIEGQPILSAKGSWEFQDSAKLFQGNMDTAYVDSFASVKTLHLLGTSLNGQEYFDMELEAPNPPDSFIVGSYKASLAQTTFRYANLSNTIYQADQLGGEFIVNITGVTSNSITGTFSGVAVDSLSKTHNLVQGKFTSKFSQLGSSGGGGGTGTATGALGVQAGVCTPSNSNGTFTQGIALNATNTLQVSVTVATPGTYTISTNSVNGVTFSNSGTFTTTGVQTVVLKGTGTPVASGNTLYTVSFSGTACNFSINYLPGVAPPVTDYYPTTTNSYWVYGKVGGTPADSSITTVFPATATFGGLVYNDFITTSQPPTPLRDTSYYRKGSGNYYVYQDFSYVFPFDSSVWGEYIFLKDSVPAGTTYNTPNFSGKVSGIPVTGYIKITIVSVAVPVTLNGISFPDVIKVKYEYMVSGNATPVGTEITWFARGVGIIYDDDGSGTVYTVARYFVY